MVDLLNYYGKNRIPFIFIIDFDKIKSVILPLNEINNKEIKIYFNGFKNYKSPGKFTKKINLSKNPVEFSKYKNSFSKVIEELTKGNSFLINLTFQTRIDINLTLLEIFYYSEAKYKLFYKNKFAVFSPEIFVKIKRNKIYLFPMKGIINANISGACEILLNDEKEFTEHITKVDLIRNDLGIVSKNVNVKKFRYFDLVKSNFGNIYQTSSLKKFFKSLDFIDLSDYIKINQDEDKIIKCRIIYSSMIEEITYEIYKMRNIKSLKIVFDNQIEYQYKYEDRRQLINLLNQKSGCDDILIVKNNLITDTSFTNVIFYDENNYVTPLNPLLKGTKREKLLTEGKIREANIAISDIKNFLSVKLINSMIDIEDNVVIGIKNIILFKTKKTGISTDLLCASKRN